MGVKCLVDKVVNSLLMLTVFTKVLCRCLGCFPLPQSPLCLCGHHPTKQQHRHRLNAPICIPFVVFWFPWGLKSQQNHTLYAFLQIPLPAFNMCQCDDDKDLEDALNEKLRSGNVAMASPQMRLFVFLFFH